jgi:hypothetical protein
MVSSVDASGTVTCDCVLCSVELETSGVEREWGLVLLTIKRRHSGSQNPAATRASSAVALSGSRGIARWYTR